MRFVFEFCVVRFVFEVAFCVLHLSRALCGLRGVFAVSVVCLSLCFEIFV